MSSSLNPYFIGLSILISIVALLCGLRYSCLNPYFIGLSILIIEIAEVVLKIDMSQSLFYWIIYSYFVGLSEDQQMLGKGLNPYFIGLSILICVVIDVSSNLTRKSQSLFYWIIYSYKDYQTMKKKWYKTRLNPYFIGLSILIGIT